MTNAWCCIPPAGSIFLALATTQVSFSRSPVLTFMRSSTLWLRRPQELFSLSYWRSLTKRISVSTHICSQYTSYYVINCNEAKLSLCVISIRFSQWWEWGKDPAHCPLQPAAKSSGPASKTRFVPAPHTAYWQSHPDMINDHFLHSSADRWPSSPLSRSPAPDRRILTSPVPASPTNPMRRLILSPSPLTQSE